MGRIDEKRPTRDDDGTQGERNRRSAEMEHVKRVADRILEPSPEGEDEGNVEPSDNGGADVPCQIRVAAVNPIPAHGAHLVWPRTHLAVY